MVTASVSLHGEKAERFREIKTELGEQLGYEPSNADTLGLVMAQWDDPEFL